MIRILIVDDQSTIQELLRSYFEVEPDLEVVGVAVDGQVAIEKVEALKPDIVLMDIEMPVIDGLTATRIISERFVATKILILSVHDNDKYLHRALQVGAKGYLLKTTPAEELVNSIRSAYKGYFQLGPGLLEKYLYEIVKLQSSSDEIEQLKKIIENQFKMVENSPPDYELMKIQMGRKINDSPRNVADPRMKNEVDDLKMRLYKLEKNGSRNREMLLIVPLAFVAILGLIWILG